MLPFNSFYPTQAEIRNNDYEHSRCPYQGEIASHSTAQRLQIAITEQYVPKHALSNLVDDKDAGEY